VRWCDSHRSNSVLIQYLNWRRNRFKFSPTAGYACQLVRNYGCLFFTCSTISRIGKFRSKPKIISLSFCSFVIDPIGTFIPSYNKHCFVLKFEMSQLLPCIFLHFPDYLALDVHQLLSTSSWLCAGWFVDGRNTGQLYTYIYSREHSGYSLAIGVGI